MSAFLGIAGGGLFMAGLGLALAGLLALASRKLYVWEDPRINEVEALLPHSNCGACGVPGCRQFAERLVAGSAEPAQCTVSPPEGLEAIAGFLGVAVGEQEKRVARLACAGGTNVARQHAAYEGLKTCRAAHLAGGGGKGCVWGCLGLGDCEVVCDFDAIHMNRHGLPVVTDDLCTACNDCVEVCPRGLFSIQPVSHRLWVACNNREKGAAAVAECEVICDGCGRCEMDAPAGLIAIRDNLAVVDYAKNELASRAPIERCPTGAIVWLDARQGAVKGREAVRIVRQEALPIS